MRDDLPTYWIVTAVVVAWLGWPALVLGVGFGIYVTVAMGEEADDNYDL